MYRAITFHEPAELGVKSAETADVPAAFNGFVDVNAGVPAQFGSPGP
jgi:hypothetical protein